MSRLATTFDRLRQTGRKALIPYVTAGDPDLATTAHILDALVEGGADVIELGVPFSDPMADGAVIQQAMMRAIEAGTTLTTVLETAAAFRARHPEIPLVLFGYLNPLYRMGLSEATAAAAKAGVDGLLVVDLPMESAGDLLTAMKDLDLDLIGLFTPTTDPERVARLGERASGFAYCVSVTGVTGGAVDRGQPLQDRVDTIQRITGLPTAVGFGVRTPADAADIAAFADGVVVGSALVDVMAHHAPVEAPGRAREFLRSLRTAMDGAEVIPLRRR
ncbi:MAG: tryptophan synthase subunit alpha [Myxococcota bacterium]|nr:tryptophan synthase subunit alpha [Myxococcota bacterium]